MRLKNGRLPFALNNSVATIGIPIVKKIPHKNTNGMWIIERRWNWNEAKCDTIFEKRLVIWGKWANDLRRGIDNKNESKLEWTANRVWERDNEAMKKAKIKNRRSKKGKNSLSKSHVSHSKTQILIFPCFVFCFNCYRFFLLPKKVSRKMSTLSNNHRSLILFTH